MRSKQVTAYTLLFFLSGATGLVYELLWVRLLYQSFGSTIQSVTTVVAAYMGGLGLGAYLLGARGDRTLRPARLYGRLEILIGLFGFVSPFVLGLAQQAYIVLARGMAEGSGLSVALRFGLAGLVLLIPTTLMGGTLPVLTRAFTATERDKLRPSLGRLYGVNTLGAVLGTAVAGFVLIEHVGIRWSLIGTAFVSIAIGLVALGFPDPDPVAVPDPGRMRGVEPSTPVLLRRLALVLLAATAFVALLDEIAWTRVLVMVVGGSTYAFTLVLLCFLLGIGLGSALIARRSETPTDAAASTVLAQGVTAAGAALVVAFFSTLPAYVLLVFQIPGLNAGPRLGLLGGAVAAVVLIPAVGMGMTFPLLTDLIASTGEARGADVGRAYLLNTVGSILGAVLTGFVLVTVLGSDATLRIGVAVNVLAALALAVAVSRGVAEGSALQRQLQLRVLGGAMLATAGLVAVIAAPGRGLRTIDLGPTIYGRERMTAAERAGFLSHMGARPLRLIEGRNSTVSVWESPVGRALKVNGKVDASDYGDMDTQLMLGLAPVAAHPHPHAALAIGFGSGVTTAVLAAVPGMDRVRVVELEPAVLELAPFFRSVNQDVLTRPNVRAIADDARSALQLTRDHFDVIVSEPSNPWVAGVATLYTPDFYRIVRGRLNDGGVFCQWVQLYQLPLSVVAGIVRNVQQVFPHVSVWSAGNYDLMVLGSAHPLVSDTAWVETLLGRGGALAVPGHEFLMLDAPQQYFDRQVLGEAGVARLVQRATLVHTDDRPQLEYVAARRFLDSRETGDILDSLAGVERPVETVDHLPPDRLARALSARLGDVAASGFVEEAHRSAPQDQRWIVPLAGLALARGDTARADSLLGTLRTPDTRALLLAGLIATARDQRARARPLLLRALAAGADTTRALAALAVLDVEDSLWPTAIRKVWGVLAATRNTFRSALPRDLIAPALEGIALQAPPAAADSVLAAALVVRPGWPKLYELRAAVLLREKRCDDAVRQFLTLEEFGLEREDAPALVERCRRGAT
jgi:spermidine synthase